MEEYIRGKGGEVRTGVRLQRIELDGCGSVAGFRLSDGSLATADLYVSAMPGAAACRGVVLAGPSRQGQGHLARVCEGRQANDVISTR
jgi:phytoene dehydrogenase-like protein